MPSSGNDLLFKDIQICSYGLMVQPLRALEVESSNHIHISCNILPLFLNSV